MLGATTYRVQRKPMLTLGSVGGALPTMASGPASAPLAKEPPRSKAPGLAGASRLRRVVETS